MTQIVQLTDTHICEPGELLYGQVDVAQHLTDAVTMINRMHPTPDMVLITGDLVEVSNLVSYEHFLGCIADLKAPVRVLPGNHDKPEIMAEAFKSTDMFPPTKAPYQYGFDCGDIHIIMANTRKAMSGLPEFGQDRLDDLSSLMKATTKPTLLALHHPPIMTGISFIDMSGTDWFKGLGKLVNANAHVELIICGHGHSEIMGRLGNVPVYMSESQAHQLSCTRGFDVAPSFIAQPSAPALHSWIKGSGFISGSYDWPEDAEENRIDKLSKTDWATLKENMKNDGA